MYDVFALSSAAGGSSISTVINSAKEVITLSTDVFTVIITNPVLALFLGCAVLTAVIALVRRLMGAAKR